MKRCTIWKYVYLVFLLRRLAAVSGRCPIPAVPLYAKVTVSSDISGTTAIYACDQGYELFGSQRRTCTGGTWEGTLPYCATDAAYRKPVNQSSTVRGGEASYANDGHHQRCTETKLENSPWWQVDLLQAYEIKVVRIITRGCCGHSPLRDLEIRVGNTSNVQGNKLCAWYPGTLGDGSIRDFSCAYPIIGQYVYVQMVGVQGSLSLCEVKVFTTQELSSGHCGNQLQPVEMTTFDRRCYEFQVTSGGSFQNAEDYCRQKGGLMVHNVDNRTYYFLSAELEQRKSEMKSKLVWLGMRRDPGLRSRTWRWINGNPVPAFMWAEDQPNNYNGQQNCVVLDGGRKWLWNDFTCDLDYLPWICQYDPVTCGSPDRNINSTIFGTDYRLGQSVTYQCPEGHVLLGEKNRHCGLNGFWTGVAPQCKYIDCGPIETTKNGFVILEENRTTFNATTKYRCDQNFSLVGSDRRACSLDGKWSGEVPKCLLGQCPLLVAPSNASIEFSGREVGSVVKYRCDDGFKLVGSNVRTCLLGGKWTGQQSNCMYVQCGPPPSILNGGYFLSNQTTTFLSKAIYSCHSNYTLIGNSQRTCLENGVWSGQDPICQLINCGQPEVPPGAFVKGEVYSVKSIVTYFCEPGHAMLGFSERTCGSDGQWTGKIPTCTYIDCGRLRRIRNGNIIYLNGTTYLHSKASYTCSPGYSLTSPGIRHCMENGRWTGTVPRCEELRCSQPEVPVNATAVFGGNDKSLSLFKIGATVQYRCIPGHIVRGHPLRTCLDTGIWSGQPPFCQFVDCGKPKTILFGQWVLSSNATYYGSRVDYHCDEGYHVIGPARRLCLDNGTWNGEEPECKLISCKQPEIMDQYSIVEGTSYTVGSTVAYMCESGFVLVGSSNRECLRNGKWSEDVPFCQIIDCKEPSVIENGRGLLLNGTTTFNSVIQYQCLPEFRMIGRPVQVCSESGEWNGQRPYCIDGSQDSENDLDGRVADTHSMDSPVDTTKVIGIAVAIGGGSLLILVVVVTLVCIKAKRAKEVKNTENVEVNPPEDKETTVMSYSRLSLESVASENSFSTHTPIRNNPNGLVTFSGHNYPVYNSSITINGQNILSSTQDKRPENHS